MSKEKQDIWERAGKPALIESAAPPSMGDEYELTLIKPYDYPGDSVVVRGTITSVEQGWVEITTSTGSKYGGPWSSDSWRKLSKPHTLIDEMAEALRMILAWPGAVSALTDETLDLIDELLSRYDAEKGLR